MSRVILTIFRIKKFSIISKFQKIARLFSNSKFSNLKFEKKKIVEQIRNYRSSFKICIKRSAIAKCHEDDEIWDKWSGSAIWRGKVLPCYNRKDNWDKEDVSESRQ